MTALIALVRKDLILFLSNQRALLLTLAMPVVLGAFFGYIFGGSGQSKKIKIEVALVVQDDSASARKIAAGLKADSALHIQELPLADAKERVLQGKLNAAIVIPPGFGEAAGAALFGAKDKPQIPIFYDPSQDAILGMVKGLLTQQVMQAVSAEMFSSKTTQKYLDASVAQLDVQSVTDPGRKNLRDFLLSLKKFQNSNSQATSAAPTDGAASAVQRPTGQLSMPYVTADEPMSSGPKYNGYAHAFAGMAVQFILFMGIDAGISILMARRMGLWSRYLAAPITMGTILGARALSSALIALVVLAFVYLVAGLFFSVSIAGSVVGFVSIAVAFAGMTAGFGLFIAAFGKTPEAARSLATFGTLILVLLGGAWVPSFVFPQWLQTATLAVPTRWAVDGLEAMTWRGLPMTAAVIPTLVLLGFALVFGALAWWRFRAEAAA